jgi:adenylyl-sulfate kinase
MRKAKAIMDNTELTPGTIWITGLCASGKTTLGQSLVDNLIAIDIRNVEFLDGEALRQRLDRVYGYTTEERNAVLMNTIRIARDYNHEGKVVIVATISHKKRIRELARQEIGHFMEVYLDCPVEVCAQRDYKGHYKKAYANEYENFVGVTEPYELSDNPELVLDTANKTVEECSQLLLERVKSFLNSQIKQEDEG